MYIKYYEQKTGGEVCEGQENLAWPDYEDEFIEWYIEGCYKSKKSFGSCLTYEETETNFAVVVGSEVHVVYVRYTTGGTFGTIYGAWEIVGCYKDENEAIKIKESIINNTYDGYRPWEGYFESFESCNIETFTVEE